MRMRFGPGRKLNQRGNRVDAASVGGDGAVNLLIDVPFDWHRPMFHDPRGVFTAG